MSKWQSFSALKRVKQEIENLALSLGNTLEDIIVTPAGEEKEIKKLRNPVAAFTCVPGVLQSLGFSNLALLTREIQLFLEEVLKSEKEIDDKELNSRLELSYICVNDLPALLEDALQHSSDNFEKVFQLLNRLRKYRECAVIFDAQVLLEKQHVNFGWQFNNKPETMRELLNKQAVYYDKCCKVLTNDKENKKAIQMLNSVLGNLSVMLRDCRAGSLWGLAGGLTDILSSGKDNNERIIHLLTELRQSLQEMIADDSLVLDKNIDESTLEAILDFIATSKTENSRISIIRQWYRLDSETLKSSRADYHDLQVGYVNKTALTDSLNLINEDISELIDIINRISQEEKTESENISDIYNSVLRLRDVLHFLGMRYLVDDIDLALSNDISESQEERLSVAAGILFSISKELNNKLENMERAVFATENSIADASTLSSAKLHILYGAMKSLESVISLLDEFVEKDCQGRQPESIEKILVELSGVFRLAQLKDQETQLQIARDYISFISVNKSVELPDKNFVLFSHLVINWLWYLEQLSIGRISDCQTYLEKGRSLADDLQQYLASRPNEKLPILHEEADQGLNVASEVEEIIPVLTATINEDENDIAGISEDEDIRAIFSEEFDEVLGMIIEEYQNLGTDFHQPQVLKDCCRYFHTLKGSGNMVGAIDIGAIGLSMENLYDHVSGKGGMTSAIMAHTARVIEILPSIKDDFINQQESVVSEEVIAELCQQASILMSDESSNDVALVQVAVEEQSRISSYEEDENDAIPADHSSTDFCAELTDINNKLISLLGNTASPSSTSDLIIPLHTMYGNARFHKLDKFSSAILLVEKFVERSPHRLITIDMEAVFREFCLIVERQIATVAERQVIAEYPEIDEHISELDSSLERLSFSISTAFGQPAADIVTEAESQQESLCESQSWTLAEEEDQAKNDKEDDADDDIDQSLLAVFLDEVEELLHELDNLYLKWQKDYDNGDSDNVIDEFLRRLHTLKGSAAIMLEKDISQAAHEYETFIFEYRDKNEAFDQAFFTSCDTRLYELHDIYRLYHRNEDGLISKAEPKPEDTVDLEIMRDDVAEVEAAYLIAEETAVEETAAEETAAEETPCKKTTAEEAAVKENSQENLTFVESDTATQVKPVSEQDSESSEHADKKNAEPEIQEVQSVMDEQVRVSSQLLRALLNDADEINFSRNRVEKGMDEISTLLVDMNETLTRLKSYVKRVGETAKTSYVSATDETLGDGKIAEEFDSLEMDRYTELQEMSLALTEDYDDLEEIRTNLTGRLKDIDYVLAGQQRLTNSLQGGLISSQMVSFSSVVPRLRRLVRQISRGLNKEVQFEVKSRQDNLDKNILQAIITPLEHMLRNAIDHGIESAEERQKAGKPEKATLSIDVSRAGASILMQISDDGNGIDVEKVKQHAIAKGLMTEKDPAGTESVYQYIFQPGFSTTEEVSNISGRGVGLDVVKSEINQIGGSIDVSSKKGAGTTFAIHLPMTSSLDRALLFDVQDTRYVVQMNTLDGVLVEKLANIHHKQQEGETPVFEYGGKVYEYLYLGKLINQEFTPRLNSIDNSVTLLLVTAQEKNFALHVDAIIESRDLVVKSLGKQLAAMQGIIGGVILPDGNVAVVLDLANMVGMIGANRDPAMDAALVLTARKDNTQSTKTVMVVDDSITVRKVTSAILKRNGMNVITAKHGMEAIELLEQHIPDMILLDIEMPKMDGFEVASYIRRQEAPIKNIPIIMITSRIGDKHRSRADEIGVNEYLCKPFQEDNLLDFIDSY